MMLVVFGHVISFGMGLNHYTSILNSFFITFRIPLFFFISGFIGYKAVERWNGGFYWQNLKKKAFVQIVPATLFYIIYCCWFSTDLTALFRKGYELYWFTIVLFEMFLVYYTSSLIAKHTNKYVVDVLMIVLSVLGVMWVAFVNNTSTFFKVINFVDFAKYLQFFTLGLLCRKYSDTFFKVIDRDLIRVCAIIAFVACFIVCYRETWLKVSSPLIYGFLHDVVIRYSGLLVIFTFFYHKRDFFERDNKLTRTMLFVGRRTLDIYMLHYFFIPNITEIASYLGGDGHMLIMLLVTLLLTLAIVGLCLLFSEIIRTSKTLGHFLLGAKI